MTTKNPIHYPLPGEKWKHYKGGVYEVITLANHTETQETLVIYKSLSFGGVYARPLSMWHDDIQSTSGIQSHFKLIC